MVYDRIRQTADPKQEVPPFWKFPQPTIIKSSKVRSLRKKKAQVSGKHDPNDRNLRFTNCNT